MRKNGFTLLEVLVAFALLSGLLALLVQSQGEAVFFLDRSAKLEAVQNEAMNRLLSVERAGTLPEPAEGQFFSPHPLAGGSWKVERSEQDFLGFPLSQIRCTLTYLERGVSKNYSTQIWGDLK
ncbi:MAG: hypothetical protein A2600_07425 [Candidatus Lambdaproteobacteria bacterium RIFOXYD1_FULL_56_27]|uniref:Type II secretion system protein GspI n=1 Tax=Candidatus Lambdaproteobacteria bacterium RIFOXYD2_FULL_56_26 TaxID=1817773 RepID=A0A1F6GVN4_9PROT|nr:MAG: hypothetical protein A2557_05320 [Candidatus Lambdaproteobacteria bacterium RIFOXYD2_FULL_56_26]OGH03759.1 MAG: hypothetical protein A2426_00875 [Candidatus Lambdaproteobacteria bacterium RIFOXYC1_FULL_56_13]OGH07343.1 MAG: hypothetical protein A2600_07425 [Candidatus Lambdaproteobacteria bacterium RIFOXYD1_FULL_56_27]